MCDVIRPLLNLSSLYSPFTAVFNQPINTETGIDVAKTPLFSATETRIQVLVPVLTTSVALA